MRTVYRQRRYVIPAVFHAEAVFPALIVAATAIFYGSGLLWRQGYGYGAALLLLTGIGMASHPRWRFLPGGMPEKAYRLFCLLILCFCLFALSLFYHHAPLHDYDRFSRLLLSMPILLLLWRYPLSIACWSGSLIIGAVLALAVAVLGSQHSLRFGGVHNPIQFGDLSLLTGLLAACMLPLTRRRPWAGLLLLTGLGAGIGASILSGSRGGWIALLPCGIFLACHLCPGRKKTLITGLVLLLLLTTGLCFLPEVHLRLNAAVSDIHAYRHGIRETSLGLRFDMWRAALHLLGEKPWLGWGSTGLFNEIHRLAASGDVSAGITAFNHLHNDYLDTAARLGIVGLSGLLSLYFVPLWVFFRCWLNYPPSPARCFVGAGVVLCGSFSLFSLSQSILAHNSGMLFYLISLMLLLPATQTPVYRSVSLRPPQ